MTMEKAVRTVVAFVLSMALYSPLLADDSSTSLQSAFQTHCVKCHGKGDKLEGKVNLLSAKSDGDLRARPELLEKVITVLQDREMPPEDEPALPAEKRQRMVRQLQALLDETLKTQPFGPTPIRRMNRFQYNNAVVDLLELDRDIFQLNERLLRRRDDYFRPETRKMPAQVRVSSRPLAKDIDNQRPEGFNGVAAFPQDKRAEHGFDNRADHLTLSPLLMPCLGPHFCTAWSIRTRASRGAIRSRRRRPDQSCRHAERTSLVAGHERLGTLLERQHTTHLDVPRKRS
jgi:mono/diheme cytochrome c family protein